MKKILLLTLGSMCAFLPAFADEDCDYTEVQQIIRDSEYLYQVEPLKNHPDLNKDVKCGGTPFQLAVVRGNYSNLNFLLKNGLKANETLVPLTGEFKVKGAPSKVPAILFAARFAPNADIIHTLLDNDVDPKVLDEDGHDFFWYLEKNPVLRRSYLVEGGYRELVSNIKKFYKEDVEDYQRNVVKDEPIEEPMFTMDEVPLPENEEVEVIPVEEDKERPIVMDDVPLPKNEEVEVIPVEEDKERPIVMDDVPLPENKEVEVIPVEDDKERPIVMDDVPVEEKAPLAEEN